MEMWKSPLTEVITLEFSFNRVFFFYFVLITSDFGRTKVQFWRIVLTWFEYRRTSSEKCAIQCYYYHCIIRMHFDKVNFCASFLKNFCCYASYIWNGLHSLKWSCLSSWFNWYSTIVFLCTNIRKCLVLFVHSAKLLGKLVFE